MEGLQLSIGLREKLFLVCSLSERGESLSLSSVSACEPDQKAAEFALFPVFKASFAISCSRSRTATICVYSQQLDRSEEILARSLLVLFQLVPLQLQAEVWARVSTRYRPKQGLGE